MDTNVNKYVEVRKVLKNIAKSYFPDPGSPAHIRSGGYGARCHNIAYGLFLGKTYRQIEQKNRDYKVLQTGEIYRIVKSILGSYPVEYSIEGTIDTDIRVVVKRESENVSDEK